MLLVPFSNGGSIALYVVAILNLQFWWNVVSGGYAGLVPDVVAPEEQGTASGWLNVMTIAGTIAGNVLGPSPTRTGHAAFTIGYLRCVATSVCLWLTLECRRPRRPAPPSPSARCLPAVLSTSIPKAHPNFYWVLVTRLLSNMGVWSVLTFLLSYLQDVIGVEQPRAGPADAAGRRRLLAIPASLIGASGWPTVMAWSRSSGDQLDHGGDGHAATCWSSCSRASSWSRRWSWSMPPPMAPTRRSTGRWRCSVLPSRDAAGKDMGIWHISMVLPQIIGPAATGWIISGAKQAVSPSFGYTVAFALAPCGSSWRRCSWAGSGSPAPAEPRPRLRRQRDGRRPGESCAARRGHDAAISSTDRRPAGRVSG